jgi:hypothetical protein
MNADGVPFHGIVVSVGWHRPTEYRSGIQFNKSLSPRYAAPLNEKSTKNHTGTFFCETPCTASIGSESHLLLNSRSQLSIFGYRRLSESHIVMEKDHTYMIGMQWIMHWKNKVGRSDLILGMSTWAGGAQNVQIHWYLAIIQYWSTEWPFLQANAFDIYLRESRSQRPNIWYGSKGHLFASRESGLQSSNTSINEKTCHRLLVNTLKIMYDKYFNESRSQWPNS